MLSFRISDLCTGLHRPYLSTISIISRSPRFIRFASASMSFLSVKVMAEYAKSGSSTCKKCDRAIASGALRLGLVSIDPRGFDMTNFHHWDCLAFNSKLLTSAEEIKGFDTLKSNDQERLKKLVREGGQSWRKLSSPIKGGQLEIAFSTSDIMDKYKDATLLPKWKAFRTIIFLERDDGLVGSRKIAAFDFDGCLAKTSVKRVGADAWTLMYPSIPKKLQSLYNDGFKLVIFSNESNIEKWKKTRQRAVDSKIGRLNQFMECVNVSIQVFIACGLSSAKEDPFRKPKTGMWHIMDKQFNSGIPIDMDQSFYVGDAAGRPNDHSDADIKFAESLGLKFHVPEEYFDS